ncbi:NnrS family protein [Roseomonas frigidaquae]|uniref:NnrS family protein n=1 Tax=Falsiroseomonas frigidaquae TaxID=487318 RepID=A0ABX1ETG0_9PROT|nr:NnrS family protein [Falsiroseomonas frigidaquae]NKE43800.1 NnrS family protein [Falsiroseomonas frigidaquae]
MMPALFRHGFRPFFLLAGAWALFAMLAWIAALHGAPLPEGPLPPLRWHAHEMIAGFIGAAMGGFLLTAVPNWTGRPGYGGVPVMLVAGLFVLARLVLLPGSPVPPDAAALLALLPIPALLLMVLPAVVAARTPRLFGPPALILLFWAGDLLMLGDAAGWFTESWAAGQLLALDVALALVGLIGGRILPAFTLNALRKAGRPVELRPLPGADRAGILALLLVVAVDQVAPGGMLAGGVAAVAALLAALRLSRWHGWRSFHAPLLWVLHLAYALVPVALGVKAAHLLTGASWAAAWLHLQGAGAVSLMILAVMTRATLGHTGRALVAAPMVTAAYLLLFAAGLVRAFGPALLPADGALALAGLLWVLAFAGFLVVFVPMLASPRPDGKPG